MHDVVIVGSGPTGLMLAAELRLAGVDIVVLERRESQTLAGSRGGGIHARTIELLDQRGIVDRFLTEGTTMPVATFGSTRIDLGRLPTRHPYTLALFQNHIERILLGWAEEVGVTIRRGVEVTGISQDSDGVDVQTSFGSVRAQYVVGADGGRSIVRRDAGIDFVGPDATRSSLIAEVQVTEKLPDAGKVDERGVHGLHPMNDGIVRVVVTESDISRTEPTLDDLRRALKDVFGTDFGVHSPTWLSRFTDSTKQAASYRVGRVLLAGDAAHVHSPTGGQGIGLGIQDAVNLGWKLGQVVRGASDESLLDTYHTERHPAGARALKYTMAQSLFQKADPRQEALRDLLDDVLQVDDVASRIASLITGLDTAYDLGPGHPLLGRRMPDLDITTPDGPTRVYEMLRDAQPVLLNFDGSGLGVSATYDGRWTLPVIGEVPAPTAVLIRPDGHVAWVGKGSTDGLDDALDRWGLRR
jgi:2-polyprenyl-6-methoxyphenol hydroxylase-like FAD-dependent oxidoreductase